MASTPVFEPAYADNPSVPHNPHITLVRANADQMARLATVVAKRLNQSLGPVAVAIPARGFSFYNRQGLTFFDAKANRTYIETLKARLPEIKERYPYIRK